MSLEHWDIRVGNSLLELKKIPKESIQTVVTSPPYWGLRDYGHDSQLGAENTPDEYVDGLVDVFREIRRVLKKDGTVWLNLGDSYIGGGKGWEWSKEGTIQKNHIDAGVKYGKPTGKIEGLKPKDLAGIPWRVAFALQEDGWWLRSDIIWHKPNPMPESVTDRPTKSHEYIFLLTKSKDYYYDQDAIRDGYTEEMNRWGGPKLKADGISKDNKNIKGNMSERGVTRTTEGLNLKSAEEKQHPLGRNKRDVWTVNTKPFPEAHFATFPEKLIDTCIKAGTSEQGECPDCGKPWVRNNIVTKIPERETRDKYIGVIPGRNMASRMNSKGMEKIERKFLGWQPDCKHKSDPIPQIVLDPFSGAGTTGVVACKLNRIYIGIELNPEYAEMSKNRLAKTVGASVSQAKDIKSPGVQLNMI